GSCNRTKGPDPFAEWRDEQEGARLSNLHHAGAPRLIVDGAAGGAPLTLVPGVLTPGAPVLVPGPLSPVAYVTRAGGRRVMLVRRGQWLGPTLLDVAQALPSQLPRAPSVSAACRRFYTALLLAALDDAGIARRSGTGPRRGPAAKDSLGGGGTASSRMPVARSRTRRAASRSRAGAAGMAGRASPNARGGAQGPQAEGVARQGLRPAWSF